MPARRRLTTEEMLGLLGAVLVVLLLLPVRSITAYTTLVVVLAASLVTLGVAAALLTYRDRSLDVLDGVSVAATAAVLVFPTAVVLVVLADGRTAELAAFSLDTLSTAAPDAARLVLQWAVPALLAFPLGLARTRRSRATVGAVFLVALGVTLVLTPGFGVRAVAAAVVQFVGAAFLGGPLFVAAGALPRGGDRSLLDVG